MVSIKCYSDRSELDLFARANAIAFLKDYLDNHRTVYCEVFFPKDVTFFAFSLALFDSFIKPKAIKEGDNSVIFAAHDNKTDSAVASSPSSCC